MVVMVTICCTATKAVLWWSKGWLELGEMPSSGQAYVIEVSLCNQKSACVTRR